jgi:hypothetical protein
MARIREHEFPADRVEHAHERGHEAHMSHRAHDAVDRVEDRCRIRVDQNRGANALPNAGHRDSGLEAAAGDVADGEHDAPVGKTEGIVPITPDAGLRLRGVIQGRKNRRPGTSGTSSFKAAR